MPNIGEDGLTPQQRWYYNNKEKSRAKSRKFQKDHAEQRNEWYRAWYSKNKDKIAQFNVPKENTIYSGATIFEDLRLSIAPNNPVQTSSSSLWTSIRSPLFW